MKLLLLRCAAALAVAGFGLGLVAAWAGPDRGPFGLALSGELAASGSSPLERVWPDLDLRALERLLATRRPARVHLSGTWVNPEAGRFRLQLGTRAQASLKLDGVEILTQDSTRSASHEAWVEVAAGPHRLELEAVFAAADTSTRVRLARGAGRLKDFDPNELFATDIDLQGTGARGAARWFRRAARGAFALALGCLWLGAAAARLRASSWPSWVLRALLPFTLALFGGGLALRSLTEGPWHAEAPIAVRELSAALDGALPDGWSGAPERQP